MNKHRGLKEISEENLEACHKKVREIRGKKARLTNQKANLEDIMFRYKDVNVFQPRLISFFDMQNECEVGPDGESSRPEHSVHAVQEGRPHLQVNTR